MHVALADHTGRSRAYGSIVGNVAPVPTDLLAGPVAVTLSSSAYDAVNTSLLKIGGVGIEWSPPPVRRIFLNPTLGSAASIRAVLMWEGGGSLLLMCGTTSTLPTLSSADAGPSAAPPISVQYDTRGAGSARLQAGGLDTATLAVYPSTAYVFYASEHHVARDSLLADSNGEFTM